GCRTPSEWNPCPIPTFLGDGVGAISSGHRGVVAMQQVLNEVGQIAQRLAGVIWQVLQFIWNWSFGQIVTMFQVPFNNLPLWKQVLFVVVIAALAYFLYKVAKDLLKAVQSVLGAIVGLISALIAMLPQIVYAGLIAFGGAWIITTMNPTWIPIALRCSAGARQTQVCTALQWAAQGSRKWLSGAAGSTTLV